jgi:hypothetical protein
VNLKLGKIYLLITLIVLAANSCDLSNSKDQITGRYCLIEDNKTNGKELAYIVNDDGDSVGIIESDVLAVGYNNHYIIVKQHPLNAPIDVHGQGDSIVIKRNSSIKSDKGSAIFYFIVPIYRGYTYFPEKGILGPLSLDEFNKQKGKLNINTSFTVNIR